MSTKQSETSIDQYIEDVIRKVNPKTVEELVKLVQLEYPLPEQKILRHILQLQDQGRIVFEAHTPKPLPPLKSYILSSKATWYWITITLTIATTLTVFTVPENAYPIVYIRYVLGSIFVLWLPGYTFIKALFPTQAPIKTSSENLDSIIRIALSSGMSLALVPIVGLLLNYTPWGIRLTPIVLSLLALTIIFATAAIIREHQTIAKTTTKA